MELTIEVDNDFGHSELLFIPGLSGMLIRGKDRLIEANLVSNVSSPGTLLTVMRSN